MHLCRTRQVWIWRRNSSGKLRNATSYNYLYYDFHHHVYYDLYYDLYYDYHCKPNVLCVV